MRYYSSIAVDTALTAEVGSTATELEVGGIIGYPVDFPFTIVIDPDTALEELCEVTDYAGAIFTVTRGFDSTTAVAHAVGATVKHVMSAIDLRETQQHMAATTDVHGVVGDVVGTTDSQALTNKTIDYDLNTITNLPSVLPSQSGNDGKYLTTDGSAPSWATITIPVQTDSTPTVLMLGGM